MPNDVNECSRSSLCSSSYPEWICYDCGEKYGRQTIGFHATGRNGECEICGRAKVVTESHNYGYVSHWMPINAPGSYAEIMTRAKERGTKVSVCSNCDGNGDDYIGNPCSGCRGTGKEENCIEALFDAWWKKASRNLGCDGITTGDLRDAFEAGHEAGR